MKKTWLREAKRIFLIVLASVLMAMNIKSFVRAGGLFPGGFNGVTLLLQQIAGRYFQISLPFSLLNFLLNAPFAVVAYRLIGRRFTLYSCLMIVLTGVLTDLLPAAPLTEDILLLCVFGGLLNGFATVLCLFADATSGGTDFIAILLSERRGVDAFNLILLGNLLMLGAAGLLFGWDRALYSIIFQFATTQVLRAMYKRYQRQTFFIITDHPREVARVIRLCTHHDATLFTGIGLYRGAQRKLVYSVVSSEESGQVLRRVREADPGAFVNVVSTHRLSGTFYRRPND